MLRGFLGAHTSGLRNPNAPNKCHTDSGFLDSSNAKPTVNASQIDSALSCFEQHPDLEPPNMLTVQTLDRVVFLYGLVDTDFQRQVAGDVASQAVGGTQVVNSIGVINR
jgi:osmotically-inducible protein OsmY